MSSRASRLGRAGLAIVWGLAGCAHERQEERELPSRGTYLSATLPQDRSKVSQYNNQHFRSKDFGTKSYRTGKSTVGKRFKAPSSEFNTTAYQAQDYGQQASPLGGQASPYADDKARTKGFAQAGKVAPTNAFSGSDKGYSTERARVEGQRFQFGINNRKNRAATRAQEKSIRASDITVSKVPLGSAAPGTIAKLEGSDRSAVRPRSLSPNDPGPGTTMSSEEVRRMLNRGQRPD